MGLPHDYVVPAARSNVGFHFEELYYWDSYFTMLGLRVAGKTDLIASMVNNFAHLIRTVGYIPNGNRTYYIGRSQPPFFALMVKLLSEINGPQTLVSYLDVLEKEYAYWMQGNSALQVSGGTLNRYWP